MADTPVDNVPADDVDIPDMPLNEAFGEQPSEPAAEAKDDGADTQDDAQESDDKPAEGEQPPAEQEQNAEEDAQAEQKRLNDLAAQKRIQDRQRLQTQQQIAQQLSETYGPKTEEQLIEEGMSRQEAQIQALREEIAFNEQRTQIATMNAAMQSDAVNALNDFGVYNPNSPDYDEQFTTMVQQQYQVAARLQADDNGIITNAEVPLYDYYKDMANIYSRGASKGNSQGQAAALQTLARVENPGGSSAGNVTGEESVADMEARLGDVVL